MELALVVEFVTLYSYVLRGVSWKHQLILLSILSDNKSQTKMSTLYLNSKDFDDLQKARGAARGAALQKARSTARADSRHLKIIIREVPPNSGNWAKFREVSPSSSRWKEAQDLFKQGEEMFTMLDQAEASLDSARVQAHSPVRNQQTAASSSQVMDLNSALENEK